MSHLNQLDAWEPGCWCAATLQLCPSQEVETEDEIISYPEQWAYLLWRPSDQALPYRRPDCWGLTVGAAEAAIASNIDGAAVYVLQPDECIWSTWLDIVLVSGDFEPWLSQAVYAAREHALDRERARCAAQYGSDATDSGAFMQELAPAGQGSTGVAMPTHEKLDGCDICSPASASVAYENVSKLTCEHRVIDDVHLGVNLVACPACGQHYVAVFAEIVDWYDGNDDQTYVRYPITAAEAVQLRGLGGSANEDDLPSYPSGRRALIRRHPRDNPPTIAWGVEMFIPRHD